MRRVSGCNRGDGRLQQLALARPSGAGDQHVGAVLDEVDLDRSADADADREAQVGPARPLPPTRQRHARRRAASEHVDQRHRAGNAGAVAGFHVLHWCQRPGHTFRQRAVPVRPRRRSHRLRMPRTTAGSTARPRAPTAPDAARRPPGLRSTPRRSARQVRVRAATPAPRRRRPVHRRGSRGRVANWRPTASARWRATSSSSRTSPSASTRVRASRLIVIGDEVRRCGSHFIHSKRRSAATAATSSRSSGACKHAACTTSADTTPSTAGTSPWIAST